MAWPQRSTAKCYGSSVTGGTGSCGEVKRREGSFHTCRSPMPAMGSDSTHLKILNVKLGLCLGSFVHQNCNVGQVCHALCLYISTPNHHHHNPPTHCSDESRPGSWPGLLNTLISIEMSPVDVPYSSESLGGRRPVLREDLTLPWASYWHHIWHK